MTTHREPKFPWLHVEFLRGNVLIKSRIYQEPYGDRAMLNWCSRGTEFGVRNRPATRDETRAMNAARR